MISHSANIRSPNSDIELYRSLVATGQLPPQMPIDADTIADYLRIGKARGEQILNSLKEDGFVTTDARLQDSIVDMSKPAVESRLFELSLYETAAVARQSRLPADQLPGPWQKIAADETDFDKLQILSIWQHYLSEMVAVNLTQTAIAHYEMLVSPALNYRLAAAGSNAPALSLILELQTAITDQNSGRAIQIVRQYRDTLAGPKNSRRISQPTAMPAFSRSTA